MRRADLSLRAGLVVGLVVAMSAVGWRTLHADRADDVRPGPSRPATAGFDRLKRELWPEAERHGVSRSTFEAAFRGLAPDPQVIEEAENQPEFERPIWDYLARRVSDARIAAGIELKLVHAADLAAIERRYGVDRHILLAIWGIESRYGERQGDLDVIRSLATLASTGSRQPFGRGQLIAALRILEAGDVARDRFFGSWAGAMGHTQFIPTTYLARAVDWTGDGRRDIWSSPADALASAANYLAKAGWERDIPWGYEVRLPQGFDYRLAGEAGRRSIGEWQRLGLRPAHGPQRVAAKVTATLIVPAGSRGPAFLVTGNFGAILAYNNSTAYGLAVGHLADRLAGGEPFVTSWPTEERALTRAERIELQQRLTAHGYDTGGTSGLIGRKTFAAVQAYQASAGLTPDGYASPDLLERLRRTR